MPTPRQVTCRRCGRPVIFAVVSNKQGKPHSRMPLDPKPDPGGNVAVMQDVTGTLVGRVLGKSAALGYETVHMPHFPTTTCKLPEPALVPAPEGVTFLDAWRTARAANAKGKRNRRGRAATLRPGMIRLPPR